MINNQKSVGTGRAAAAAPLDKYSAALSSLSAVSQQSLSTLSAVFLILSHTGGAQNTSSWFYKTIIFSRSVWIWVSVLKSKIHMLLRSAIHSTTHPWSFLIKFVKSF